MSLPLALFLFIFYFEMLLPSINAGIRAFKKEPVFKLNEKGIDIGLFYALPNVRLIPWESIDGFSISLAKGLNLKNIFINIIFIALSLFADSVGTETVSDEEKYLVIRCDDLNKLLVRQSIWVQFKHHCFAMNRGFGKNSISIPLRFFEEPDTIEATLNEYLNSF